MTDEKDIKKTERKAKNLLLSKDIPPEKMDIVRSLIKNPSISQEEKYSAVIQLIQSCPDKPVSGPRVTSIELRQNRTSGRTRTDEQKKIPPAVEPSLSGIYIGDIEKKYKKLKFFKKRYLTRADNRLGWWFKKRLIPTKKLLKVLREVNEIQYRLMSSLDPVLIEILKDDSIQDASGFNYLVLFKKIVPAVPLSRYDYEAVRWMERPDFERDIKDYASALLSFRMLQAEIKEMLIALVDGRLRGMEGFIKTPPGEKDDDRTRTEKEKRNLAIERNIYNYILDLRAFLSAGDSGESPLSNLLKSKYGLPSLTALIHIISEGLVFHRELSLDEMASYYEASPPVVASENFNYSREVLKKYGRDEQSRKNRIIDELKSDLTAYEEIFTLLKHEISGQNFLLKCHDDQWKIADRRRGDSSETYQSDFVSFIDSLINYFNNSLARILDGSVIVFEDPDGSDIEGRIFTGSYFERELAVIEDLTREFYYFRNNNPNLMVPYEEMQRIFKGQIKSMAHVNSFMKKIGSTFYSLGESFHKLYSRHRLWAQTGLKPGDTPVTRTPLGRTDREEPPPADGRPLPYHDCRIRSFQGNSPLVKTLFGIPVIKRDFTGGIIIMIMAFCYQLALECGDESIQGDLEYRKKLLSTLRQTAAD